MSFALAAVDGTRCGKPSAQIGKVTLNLPSPAGSAADMDRAFGSGLELDNGRIIGVAAGQSTVN
jgi:hypothetical protein